MLKLLIMFSSLVHAQGGGLSPSGVRITSAPVPVPITGTVSILGVVPTNSTGPVAVATGSITAFQGGGPWLFQRPDGTYSMYVSSGFLNISSGSITSFQGGVWTILSRQDGVYTMTPGTGTWPVTGTFFPAIQPTTLASSPTVNSVQLGPYSVSVTSGGVSITGTSSVFISSGQLSLVGTSTVYVGSGTVVVSTGSITAFKGGSWDHSIIGVSSIFVTSGTLDILDLVSAFISSGNVALTGTSSVFIGSGTVALSTQAVVNSTTGVIGSVSLGNTSGKTELHKTFFKNTSAIAATILGTYTVTVGKTLYITHLDITGALTTISATGSKIGDISIVTPAGTSVSSMTFYNATTSAPQMWVRDYAEPWAIPSGSVFMSSVTPAVTTGMNWIFNWDGYEK